MSLQIDGNPTYNQNQKLCPNCRQHVIPLLDDICSHCQPRDKLEVKAESMKCPDCGRLKSFTNQAFCCDNPTCGTDKPFPKGVTIEYVVTKKFSTGAVRSKDADDVRFDLITPIGLRRLAETYAEGAKKYGDDNWLKGIPDKDCINHALRHINQWIGGDCSEDHLAHAVWNLMTVMHFEEVMPEMTQLYHRVDHEKKNSLCVPVDMPAVTVPSSS